MQQSLDKVGATRYYAQLATAYNHMPLGKPVQADLTRYATGKAVDGSFTLIAREEANIRQNPGGALHRVAEKGVWAQWLAARTGQSFCQEIENGALRVG